jgi:hypothetical protein
MKLILLLFIINLYLLAAQVELFQPNIISNNQVFGLTKTPGGKTVFFVEAFGGRDTLRIMQSNYVNGIWEKPQLAFFANKNYKEIDPFVSPDGSTILFNANKNDTNDFDIFAVYKKDNKWSEVVKLPNTINSKNSDFYATMSLNKNIYFTRRTESNDIYVSYFINNKYEEAIKLDTLINTDKAESNPFISKNEDYLIFFSNREGGFGEVDLYVSFKINQIWSKPINLGNVINSNLAEFCPFVDENEGFFYFSRTELQNKIRVENIYRIKLSELNFEALKKSAILNK